MVSIEEQLCLAIEKCDSTPVKIEVQRLVKSGVNVNTLTEDGISPMHWACGVCDEAAHMEIVKLLLSNGGDPNIKSTEEATPVHVASSWGFLEILKVLIKNGGDPWLKDLLGCNAWDLALKTKKWSILKYLASYMEDDHVEPAEDSVQCIFVKHWVVDLDLDRRSISNISLRCNNLGESGSVLSTTDIEGVDSSAASSPNDTLNMAVCLSPDVTNNSSNSSVEIVEEIKYTDAGEGIELLEWHFQPCVNQESVKEASKNEALCTSDGKNSVNWIGDSMDSDLLFEQLKTLGSSPGSITPTTKQSYLRQFYRLRLEAKAAHAPLQISFLYRSRIATTATS